MACVWYTFTEVCPQSAVGALNWAGRAIEQVIFERVLALVSLPGMYSPLGNSSSAKA